MGELAQKEKPTKLKEKVEE